MAFIGCMRSGSKSKRIYQRIRPRGDYIGHKLFRGANLSFKVLGTNSIFGIAGRLVPAGAVALGVYDLARIMDKAAECYEKAIRKT